jgi:hypothetical protein
MVAARDLGVEKRPQERGVVVRVQQVEGPVAAETLLLDREVRGNVQRSLEPAGTIMNDEAPRK